MSLTDLAILDPLRRCAKASQLVYAGQYEEAKSTLGDLWRGVGERPAVADYPSELAAEILLQCACLSGFLGDAQAKDVHEKAKDLITEALHTFQAGDNEIKVSECNYELGICYYRAGAFDEARIVLNEAFSGATPEQHGKIVIGCALVEIFSGRCGEAQEILLNARPFFETASDALKARWHAHMGLVQRRLARGRIEHLDRAIIEYTRLFITTKWPGTLAIAGAISTTWRSFSLGWAATLKPMNTSTKHT